MTLAAAYASSIGGLAAVATWADATATNIANVDRPGYARRSVTNTTGLGGVTEAVISTERDATVERIHRLEIGRLGRQQAVAELLSLHTARLGQPGDASGLTARLSALETSMIQMSTAPEDAASRSAVVDAAVTLAETVNAIAGSLDEVEAVAINRIDQSVVQMNRDLQRIAQINAHLSRGTLDAPQRASFEDELAGVADRLARLGDIRTTRGAGGGTVAFTSTGTVLVSGSRAEEVAFDATAGTLTAVVGMTEVDVTPTVAGARGPAQGRLSGEFAVLLDDVPRMRSQIDAFAAGLVHAFEGADTTRAAGQPGLFTDSGASPTAPYDGLASRLSVNDVVQPDGSGQTWRLRDGFGASAEGPAGDPTLVLAYVDALTDRRAFSTAEGLPTAATLGGHAAALVTAHHAARVTAEDRSESIAAGATAIGTARRSATGVDVDAELHALSRLQQSYRANSEAIRAISDMLDTLLAAV
ncbi:hypothetical protein JQC91_05125 [Jannaschia sp. Os4]|uniref:FlgK family flagellar hook-associated protein n=1 Tax=Jannaschia sp. Os4 TaxID=2807617 RepID=UPI00193A0DA4|nr:flagellar basal body rod C-terminal domain-containing protein [Jannaschia sp. Os4]MBM2575681.1 hypothetical protein [Jannaschia sp. Os4]